MMLYVRRMKLDVCFASINILNWLIRRKRNVFRSNPIKNVSNTSMKIDNCSFEGKYAIFSIFTLMSIISVGRTPRIFSVVGIGGCSTILAFSCMISPQNSAICTHTQRPPKFSINASINKQPKTSVHTYMRSSCKSTYIHLFKYWNK